MTSSSTSPTTQSTTSSPCTCLPCDVPAFCRTGYFTGKLLTALDFTNEQIYHINKLRLHHTGPAWVGLDLRPQGQAPSKLPELAHRG